MQKAMGRSIKLLATSRGDGNGYYAMVAPFMLGEDHPLNNVNGVFNAIFVHGNMLEMRCSMEAEQENSQPQVQ